MNKPWFFVLALGWQYLQLDVYLWCIHIHIHIHIHTYMHTYIRAYIHTYIHTYIRYATLRFVPFRCVTLHFIAYMHACIHTYIHACMHACIQTYANIHTHTHTHTHIYTGSPKFNSHAGFRLSVQFGQVRVILVGLESHDQWMIEDPNG